MSRPALSSVPSRRDVRTGNATWLVAVVLLPLLVRSARPRRDRGDVPGWVLITVMTAGLVSAIWMFAGPALVDLFRNALAGVSGP